MEFILIIVMGAIVGGFGLIMLLSIGNKGKPGTRFQAMVEQRFAALDFGNFERICTGILENLKLDILERQDEGEGEFSLLVRNPAPIVGGKLLVHGLMIPENEEIKSPRVMELSDNIVSGRLTKGIFMTTGRFAPEVAHLPELAPMEFIDGEMLKSLTDKYKIPV